MAKTILGLDGKLFRSTGGTFGSPTWDEVKNVKDLSLTIEKSEADASSRASRYKLVRGAMKEATIEFNMIYDPTDADWTAIKTAFLGDTSLLMGVMDGASDAAGTEGFKADFEILKWNTTQNLEEVFVTEITIKPTRSANEPTWFVVSA